MANCNGSLSLLESPEAKPAMSQEVNEDGVVTFKCNTCNAGYKQLKRLQTHLKIKHNMSIDLDETMVAGNFSPLMASTIEDAVNDGSPKVKKEVEPEPTKRSTRKRERSTSDEDDEEEIERYRREKDKRSKMLDELAGKFEVDISNKTMENAAIEVEESINNGGETQAMADKISLTLTKAIGGEHVSNSKL